MIPVLQIKAGTTQGTATQVYFTLITDATDYVTPETGEAGGQPEISTNGAAWTTTGIGTLTSTGNGSYYAVLTTSAVNTAGRFIQVRYKSSNTSESRGTSVITTVYAPASETQTVSVGPAGLTGASIQDGALTRGKFGTPFINQSAIDTNTHATTHFQNDFLTNEKLADLLLGSENLASGFLAETKVGAAAFTAAKFGSDVDTYTLNARLTQVDGSNQRYVLWVTKNGGVSVASASYTGTPTITAVKASDGSTLIDAQNLTAYGTTGSYRYAASGGSLLAAGEDVDVVMTATIDGTARTLKAVASKQYTA